MAAKIMPIWRVPGFKIIQEKAWSLLTLQEVEGSGGDRIWRSDKHRVSLIKPAYNYTVRFENGRTREFSPRGPTLFFSPAGVTMHTHSGGPLRWVQIVATPGLARRQPLEPLEDFQDALISQAIVSMAREINDTPTDRLVADTLNMTIALRLRQRLGEAIPPVAGGLSPQRLRRVREYVDAHLGQELDLRTLADVAALTATHFSRSFKIATGIGIHVYVAGMRLEKAKNLLVDDALTIAQVAAAVGFTSVASFSTFFTRRVGMTPGRYRQEMMAL